MVRRSILALTLSLGLLVAGCGDDADGGEEAAGTSTPDATAGTVPVGPDDPEAVEAFCEALRTMTTSGDPREVLAVYDQMEANAPASIAAEVDAFVTSAREISTAFAPLGSNASAEAIDAAIAGLSPEARDTLEQLTATGQIGQVPTGDDPTSVVLRYGIETCGLGDTTTG